jgi:mono/diheme cytochrome c family protein
VLAGVLVIAGCFAVGGAAGEPGELLRAAARGSGHPTVRRGENCLGVEQHSLPLPSTVPASQFVAYEKQFLSFLERGEYRTLGWCVDKGVRDTGPFIEEVSYGTHPAVRIYYSPTYMRWLTDGRQGTVPDGALVIKEQYRAPAARYAGLTDAQLPAARDWTIMYKDAGGSKDGWFWAEFFTGMAYDDDQPPFQYPWAGFGLSCLRCHAIAEQEHTFGSLNNIKGFPGEPIVFFVDDSWKKKPMTSAAHGPRQRWLPALPRVEAGPDPEFLRIFNSIPAVPLASVQKLPSETYDNAVAPASGPGSFMSSTQCLPCHSGLNPPFGPVMFLPSTVAGGGDNPQGANVSPYGEWRWSPMGLAGRDPIFYSQLEGEFAYFNTLPPAQGQQLTTTVRNLCLSCHGAMGKRQLDTDSGGSGDFTLDLIQLTDRDNPRFKYGALARDGISCEVCHRQVPDRTPPGTSPLEYFLANSTTGRFQVATPDQLFGPFADDQIVPFAMTNGIGVTPQFNPYIQSSRMCGSCHTIDLPIVDAPGRMSIEQATYLEWLNSQYQTEFGRPGPNAVSCQGCHMPRSYHNAKKGIDAPTLEQKIAIIEDEGYPEAEHAVPLEDRTVQVRKDFSRHELVGANAFLLQMFESFKEALAGQYFNGVLGVRIADYMSGSTTDLQDAIDNITQQAQERTARVTAVAQAVGPGQIQADLAVTSLVGHRLPSGVGFRRAFLETLVKDAQGRIVWSSGRTNHLGIILDGNGQILPSEFFTPYTDAQGVVRQHYQPHYEVITAQDQVQIYEELVQNADGQFTTSFVRRDHILKDNRLLPIGWTRNGPDPSLNGRFLEATHPEGSAADDPDYQNGRGIDRIVYQITLPPGVDALGCTVQVTLRYQAIPPSYLNARFSSAPTGDATRRLYYLTSNLNLEGTSIENWSLPLASITTPVARGFLTTAD